ncbi:MAG: cell wall-binding repeat-containing protein, partial [Acidimicrobiales bacterium]
IPGVAADPANPRHIVLDDENFVTGQCEYHVSFDGGATWAGGNLTAPAGFQSPPCKGLDSGGYPHMNQSVAFGSNGQVYAVFDSTNGTPEVFTNPTNGLGQGDSVLVAKSSDGGRTFAPAVVAILAPPGPAPMYVRPTIGVEARPNGDRVVVAAWGVQVTSGGPADGAGLRSMNVAVSNDGGATYSAPVVASAPGEQIREPSQPVFGPDGAIYVAWTSRDNGVGTNIEVGKSIDGGATWTRSAAGAVTGHGQGVDGGMPQLATNPSNGSVYVVYQATQVYGDQDIFFQRSTDGGATWSQPLRVNDDPTGNGVRQQVPHIAVAPNGRIDVDWLDHRNGYQDPVTPAPGGEVDVYYASSADGGVTFSANRRITDRTINMDMGDIGAIGAYAWFGPVLADLGNNGVFFAWSDPRDGNADNGSNDVFTATLHLGAAAGDQLNVHKVTGNDASLAVQVSRETYPGGGEKISNPAIGTRVVLVNENDAASALVGAVLARSYYGPELVTPANSLPKSVRDEIVRLRPAGVFVLGDDKQISAAVVDALKAIVPQNVVRLGTPDRIATAVAVAQTLDLRSGANKAAGKPAFGAVVVVNPDSPDAVTAAGFAAEMRYPVLFSGRDAVPEATLAEIRSLNVTSEIVVGGADAISASAMSMLPNAKRVGGLDESSTSAALVAEAATLGVPTNLVYLAPKSNAVDAGVMGASIARRGGLLILADDPSSSNDAALLKRLNLQPDQVWIARPSEAGVPWLPIVLFAVLGLAGAVLLGVARSRSRSSAPAVTAASE